MQKSPNSLKIENLRVKIENKEIIKGFSLEIKPGELHVIMGPNGSGKSTLCYALMGHTRYKANGKIILNGKNIGSLPPDKRAKEGLFLGFQQPREVPGVTFGNFLRLSSNAINKQRNKAFKPTGIGDFYTLLENEMKTLKMDKSFIGRSLNDGFSGGEKKRAELLQMSILKPKYAILDEIDSGLDIDGLKIVAGTIDKIHKKNKPGILIITHYRRILDYLEPDHVHVMINGRIVKSGGHKLAGQLEKQGYEQFLK
jgi:Fe-S cluster assembly ATP-binding protein